MSNANGVGGRSGPQHPPRPPIHSQHSSSVPSTPYQQPRDIRFHSRSPSPNRGLSNQSPRSVVSEATGSTAPQKAAPVVCKFETGSEFKKRRIPYVEGGNEELGPPKKEPKKTLEPDEREKLSGDMRELYDRLLPSDESEERRAKLVVKLERILNEEWPGHDIKVHVFGSSGNLLSSTDSDVDICITTPLKKLESMHSIATLLHKNGMEKVVCRGSAKVPIVKCWDPELKLAADLNVNNTLALENTRMIKTYVQLDDRVRPLAKIIKYWTKRRILNDAAFGGTISSYTWICMILSFLQRRNPPILPSLQKMADRGRREQKDNAPKFADDLEALKGCGDANKETLAELLFQFFRHYGYEFEYSKHVVSVKEGKLMSRHEKGWDPTNYKNKEAQNRLCVEEPFTVIRNLGNSADDYAWSGIHGEIRRAFDLLADGGQLEKCCEQYEFPPEEKTIFQKPVPKPKPTLTRSASQSGRPHQEQGSGRSRKGANRNQSAQRAGNRRASSGASFSNQRVPLGFQSPPLANGLMDYFAAKADWHNNLYSQYAWLQAQQEALQARFAAGEQLLARQQQHSSQTQSQRTGSDVSGSPRTRPNANGLPSPRFVDNAPQTAPLLPGYLYHYSPRYPPPSLMMQARARDSGTSTNPSSPSMTPAVPALRRQVHRGSLPEGSTGWIRSQSQPGRSLPHPLALQQQVHPGYDVSGALGQQYQNGNAQRTFSQNPLGIMPFSPVNGPFPSAQSVDSAIPKEYMGYIVGQSPSFGPQYPPPVPMRVPPISLRDPPVQRSRKVTPELLPPLLNGRHSSRSPSPLGHPRSYSTVSDLRPTQPDVPQSPPSQEQAQVSVVQSPIDVGAPVIVNGSTPSASQRPAELVNGFYGPPPPYSEEFGSSTNNDLSRVQSLPLRPILDTALPPEQLDPTKQTPTSPRMSPTPRTKAATKFNFSPNGTPPNVKSPSDLSNHELTPIAAPLLSPVAELRTPSPTQSNSFERDSPRTNGLMKAAKIASAKQVERNHENEPPTSPIIKHERKGSAPNPTLTKPLAKSPTLPTPSTNASTNQNPWQQATRKGHKKSKSTATAKASGGQPLPANEFERKGG